MTVPTAPHVTRSQILGFRRRAGHLDRRLPFKASSLRRAAWAGLQDSVPRAALLSLHARVTGVEGAAWEAPSLVQLWGPRYCDYLVASTDLAVFSLGRLPSSPSARARAEGTATALDVFLEGRRMPFGEAGRAMGVSPNALRYAAPTGRVLLRWDGARQPLVWTVPAPRIDPSAARLELARRYLHVLGPATPDSFARWAGIARVDARAAFDALRRSLVPVHTPIGPAWILAEDEAAMRVRPELGAPARLLPSGDPYCLLWGADRELAVPNGRARAALWTSRVWPGALLVDGEFAGVWRRTAADVSIESWRRLTARERHAVEAEAALLPVAPGTPRIHWTGP